jgi:hypothetical protein
MKSFWGKFNIKKRMIEFLKSNECLITCHKYYLPKLPLKQKYNVDKILLSKSLLILDKTEKIEAIINDYDANCLINIEKRDSDLFYFEDVIHNIGLKDPKSGQIFNNLFFLLTPDYCFDEIVYLTGYKEDVLLSFFKKYKYLFNVIVEE